MEKFSEIFKRDYYQKMITPSGNNPVRNRADSFLMIIEMLEKKNSSLHIIESGCSRATHGELNWAGDGCSTILFDRFLAHQQLLGHKYNSFVSVDIDQENCNYAKQAVEPNSKTEIICSDSVNYFWKLPHILKFDLVYLDSYDILESNPHPSMLHHLKELCAVIKNVESGALIAVDDHQAFFNNIGKGNYVKSFMQDIGAKILYEGYQIIFEMP